MVAHHKIFNEKISQRFHQQFAYPKASQLLNLINKVGQPWSSNNVLKSGITKITKSCDACQWNQKPPPGTVVRFPMSEIYLDTLAMHLKYWEEKIIQQLIDICARLSAATFLRNNHPDKVIKNFKVTNKMSYN